MAKKIEIEKPVVSKELAERFSYLKDYYGTNISGISDVINICNYNTQEISEYKQLSMHGFEILLAKMYVVGYEVEKPKYYVLKLPVKANNGLVGNICRDSNGMPRYKWLVRGKKISKCYSYPIGFTKEEIEADEDLNKLAGACELVEVED